MGYFSEEVVEAARKDAVLRYPHESCGLVIDGAYVAVPNIALAEEAHKEGDKECECVKCSFRMDGNLVSELTAGKNFQGVIHSHPDGDPWPSKLDMEGQVNTDVPWGLMTTDGHACSEMVEWGDAVPIAPLVGRRFIHGVHDCFSLIRDTFRLGRVELAKQGIDWPFDPIIIEDCPRDDAWWTTGQDLYLDGLAKRGFRQIAMSEARPGDGCLFKVGPKVEKMNHGAVLLGGGLMLHHLPGVTRVSRREPVGGWGRIAEMWVRYDPDYKGK
jgi:proteasome lid subunit RPN8/RPN11